ncbi:MAG: DUF86 domain-containing protein [Bacteroidales bacterium]|nr:DUF86 domain-containing protein [Bacteroidales bacterium]
MDRKVLKYLQDIFMTIEEIELFMQSRPKEYQVFCDDLIFRRAVERNLEIIGEAMNRALKIIPDLPVTSARKIVDMRNFVIHSYDSLRPDIIWGVVIKHLPLLKAEISRLLE